MFAMSKLSPSVTDMIRFDHSHVLVTFHQYTAGAKPRVKKALTTHICTALEIHATLEEECFYPVMRRISSCSKASWRSSVGLVSRSSAIMRRISSCSGSLFWITGSFGLSRRITG